MSENRGAMLARARLEALPCGGRARRAPWAAGDRPPLAGDWMPGDWFEQSPEPSPRLPRLLQGLRVLVVDDDEETSDLFAAALTACGAHVTTAASASDALRELAARRPDVVVSDIAMPGGDGYWLVREMARLADHGLDRVPVIAVTAFGREHSRARVLGAGFTDHLQKPVDPEALCRAVARAAGR